MTSNLVSVTAEKTSGVALVTYATQITSIFLGVKSAAATLEGLRPLLLACVSRLLRSVTQNRRTVFCSCQRRGFLLFQGQCDCKANVIGKNCDMCKPLYYDLDRGCVRCNCFLPGTLDGVGECDEEVKSSVAIAKYGVLRLKEKNGRCCVSR